MSQSTPQPEPIAQNETVQPPTSLRALRRVLNPRRIRRFQIGALISLFAGLLAAGAILSGGFKQFEPGLADLFYRPRQPSGNVVLIAIDDRTVDEYGWPIERITHRGFIFAVARSQPKVIALDLVMPDPSDPEDALLAPIIGISGKVIQPILGIEATRFPAIPNEFPAYDSTLGPAPALRTPNTTLAHIMLYPDADGVVRRIPLAIDAPGKRYPALALAAIALYEGRDPTAEIKNGFVAVGDKRVPVDDQGQMVIGYIRHSAIKIISYADITQGKADYAELRDKIVLVGPISKAASENYAVPFPVSDARAFNVEIQADVIETLLSGKFMRGEDQVAQIISVLLIAAIAGLTLPHFRWLYATVLTIFYFVVYLLYAYQRFDDGIIVTPLYTTFALFTVFVLCVVYRYFSEERARRFISRIFYGRIAPEAVPQVIEMYNRGALALTGGRRQVTVLCATLRGISALSEVSAPETVIDLLDKYTTVIIETVFQSGGSITSQVGNTVVATWNFPLAQPDHAQRAVSAAFEIQRAIAHLHPDTPEASEAGIGIGIASGAVVVGHLSALQADYSIVGDVVTLAERVTALASAGQVLVSPETRAQIGDAFDTRHIHSLRTRGKKDPIFVWEADEKSKI